MRCVAAILARNEADRYLKETIESLQPLCDKILVLDDGSTDSTIALSRSLGCEVRSREALQPMWGQESTARQQLWAWGSEEAGDGWLYISDSDHVTQCDPSDWRQMLTSWNVNAWAFPLLDLWDSPTTFRVDGFWQGYKTARPWLFKPSVSGPQSWSDRGIHTGHCPQADWLVGLAERARILHLGWMKESDRKEKYLRYAEVGDSLSPWEKSHLQTVLE